MAKKSQGKMTVIPPCEVCENSTNVSEHSSGDWICSDCGYTWER